MVDAVAVVAVILAVIALLGIAWIFLTIRAMAKPFQKLIKQFAGAQGGDPKSQQEILKAIVTDITQPSNPIGALLSFLPTTVDKLKNKPELAIGLLRTIPAGVNVATAFGGLLQRKSASSSSNLYKNQEF